MQYLEALKAMRNLDDGQRVYVIKQLIDEKSLSVQSLLIAQVGSLEQTISDQKYDIGRLATAGIELGKGTIKKAKHLKNSPRRQSVIAGQARSLLSTGVYRDTKFEEDLNSSIKDIKIEESWYESSWKLKSIKESK